METQDISKNPGNGDILIYQSEDGRTHIDVRMEQETVWLTQQQLCELYQTSKSNISEHIKHIFEDGELDENVVVRKFRTTTQHGAITGKTQSHEVTFYNLDMIISLGYRIRSVIATRFRQWATKRLNEYIVKGFTMDDERLKNLGGGNYWKELLDRIRDIRSSEKVLYRQVLDLYATSVDYNPKSELSIEFFKIVQNKLHFMGMTNFKGDWPTLKEAFIAKNYLSTEELKVLNNLVSGYFDFAEIQAMRHVPMYMSDYIQQLDSILSSTGQKLLDNAGQVSHQQAIDKATEEYRKWQNNTLSPVEEAYLENIKTLEQKTKKLK